MFTEKERAYLSSQRLARLATVSPSGSRTPTWSASSSTETTS